MCMSKGSRQCTSNNSSHRLRARQVCASRASTLAATASAVRVVQQLLATGEAAAARQFAEGALILPYPPAVPVPLACHACSQ